MRFPKNPNEGRNEPLVAGDNPFADAGQAATTNDNPFASPAADIGTAAPQIEYERSLPHRGGFILTLGILGLVSFTIGTLGLLGLPPAVVIGALSFVMTVPAWLLGSSDLRAMKAGAMDTAGRGKTRAGMILGIAGTLLTVMFCIGLVISLVQWIQSGAELL